MLGFGESREVVEWRGLGIRGAEFNARKVQLQQRRYCSSNTSVGRMWSWSDTEWVLSLKIKFPIVLNVRGYVPKIQYRDITNLRWSLIRHLKRRYVRTTRHSRLYICLFGTFLLQGTKYFLINHRIESISSLSLCELFFKTAKIRTWLLSNILWSAKESRHIRSYSFDYRAKSHHAYIPNFVSLLAVFNRKSR